MIAAIEICWIDVLHFELEKQENFHSWVTTHNKEDSCMSSITQEMKFRHSGINVNILY